MPPKPYENQLSISNYHKTLYFLIESLKLTNCVENIDACHTVTTLTLNITLQDKKEDKKQVRKMAYIAWAGGNQCTLICIQANKEVLQHMSLTKTLIQYQKLHVPYELNCKRATFPKHYNDLIDADVRQISISHGIIILISTFHCILS